MGYHRNGALRLFRLGGPAKTMGLGQDALTDWDGDAEGLSAFQTYVFKPTDVVRPPMNSLNRLRNGGTIAPLICNPNSHFGEVL